MSFVQLILNLPRLSVGAAELDNCSASLTRRLLHILSQEINVFGASLVVDISHIFSSSLNLATTK